MRARTTADPHGVSRARLTAAALALCVACASHPSPTPGAASLVAPKACRASGLWVLERHVLQSLAERWETLAMAPWPAWATGFALADGRGSGLAIRVSYADMDQIELTGAQSGEDRDPAVFRRRAPSDCVFYTSAEEVVYRFRRER